MTSKSLELRLPERTKDVARITLYGRSLESLLAEHDRRQSTARLYVTPNLDHLRLLKYSAALRRAYRAADFVVNDSRLLDRLALRGRCLCAPGADWVPRFLDNLAQGTSVLVIGYTENVRRFLDGKYRGLKFDYLEPSMGYFARRGERRAILAQCRTAAADVILLCTGAPRSEILGAQIKRALARPAEIICCGSTLQFLAGDKKRAPGAFRSAGGEWLWRFMSEPYTRKRYLLDALFLLCNLGTLARLRRRGTGNFKTFELASQSE